MFDMFLEGSKYYDYPSFEVAIYSLLLALVLSSLLAFTYSLTAEGEGFSKNLFQGMVLSSLVTSMIMMAVGNNMAVGFGIMGAVAIIRFRTNIQKPRNIIFMFGALSIGITTGVYGYAVALAGSIIFCLTAFLLHFSNLRIKTYYFYQLECGIAEESVLEAFKSKLDEVSISVELMDVRERAEKSNKYEFLVKISEGMGIQELFTSMQMEGVDELKINKKTITESL